MHGCAGIEYCAPSLMQLVIVLHPEQLFQFDENGNLPIHVAASCKFLPEYPSEDGHAISELDLELSGSVRVTMETLLRVFSDGARVCNHDGKMPLELAINSGKDWDDGIGALVEAYPEALGERDPSTGLFPFMSAAVEETSIHTVTYGLLRSYPELERYF